MIVARIYRSAQREFVCKTDQGQFITARAIGNLLKDHNGLVVGDFVKIVKDEGDSEYSIIELIPRKNEIFRISVREAKRKSTAANVDLLIIVMSGSRPEYKRGIVDRFLVRASQWQIRPILVFNKMDEFDQSFDLKFESDRLKSLGVVSYEISASDEQYSPKFLSLGMRELQATMQDKTALFIGQSGVGKSTIINALTGNKIHLKTQDLGKVGKGMHTTTWSEIIDCGSFNLVDSPGIRSLSLEDLGGEDLIEYFPDLEQAATRCQFRKCNHESSATGCAFHKEGPDNYEQLLLMSRLESFQRISEDLAGVKTWNKRIE